MARSAKETRQYSAPLEYFSGKLRAVESAGLNVSLKSENPTESGVWFRIHHGMTAASYGERITVTLTRLPNGGTGAEIESECVMPTQMFDAGKNKSNVNVIFGYLEKDMPASFPAGGAFAPSRQTPPPQQTPPAGTAKPQPKFCIQCGKPLQPGAKFCIGCGRRISG